MTHVDITDAPDRTQVTRFRVREDGVVWTSDGETVSVLAWGEHSVRVRAAVMSDIADTDWALLSPAPAGDIDIDIDSDGNRATLDNGRIRVVLENTTQFDLQVGYETSRCQLSFFNSRGELLFRELDAGGSLKLRARNLQPHLGGDFRLTAAFEAAPDEHLLGMGQYQQDIVDLKGSTLELAHRNSQSSVPFVLSSRGYGFLWHNPAIGRATFGRNRTEWFAESTRQLDYWVTAGDTPAQISSAYADATGHAPMMPEYGLGFWQCKLRYWNQEQLLEVAREHKRRGLPLDVIVADFFHWPKMGDFRFEEEFWPDPAAMVDELNSLGVELMVSVWPQISIESENYAEMRAQNLLVKSERGLDIHMQFEGPSAFLDATNPEARAYVWDKCRTNYGAYGIRTFWLDEAEPEYGVYDFDNFRYRLGSNVQVGNIYPQHFARAFFDGQTGDGQQQVVNLLRTAWAGSQRYGALVWSGDIQSTFAALRSQITAGIHMGVAGIPWFTTDIGGFHGGRTDDPDFRELLIRWFQFGTFCPVMRLHGDRVPSADVYAADGSRRSPTGAANEVWSYGADVYGVLERYLHLREALRPYTRDTMRDAHTNGQPVMRGLFHEFPDDPQSWVIADQYLFGRDLLVAPVVQAGARRRRVYLPAGATWTDVATGMTTAGGTWRDVEAPLGEIPLFLRGGAAPSLVAALDAFQAATSAPRGGGA